MVNNQLNLFLQKLQKTQKVGYFGKNQENRGAPN